MGLGGDAHFHSCDFRLQGAEEEKLRGKKKGWLMKKILILAVGIVVAACGAPVAQKKIPDVSKIRGFNYQSAPTLGHAEHWLLYDPAETERDMDFAKRLNLNQARVFVSYTAWMRDKVAFRKNLVHLVRASHQRGIDVMPTFQYPRAFSADKEQWPKTREYIADIVNTIGNGKEPGLAFWDAANEPGKARIEFARYVAGIFRELDKVTPVTIGSTFEDEMEATGSDAVDVLCFHDYSQTRAQVRANIEKAKAFAAKEGKQVMNTEFGCIARANPYDLLEEYWKAGMGWYMWELMITHQWGRVHGIFYPDGTVRDPSIVASVMGFFRNRGREILPEVADAENQVTKVVADSKKWLADANGTWEDGLDIAEREANLLEGAQLIAMYDPPTRTVALMRGGKSPFGMPTRVQPDVPALRVIVQKWMDILEPHQLPIGDSRRSRDFGWIR
jgi:hypothetical protein